MLRWALGIGLGLVVLLITVVGAVFALADHYDLAPLAARHLAISLERKVTIGSLHVTPGRWLHVELRDFHLANLPGGTQPVMATMISASAEIDALSLLYGPIVVRRLMVNGLQILLEHTSDDRKNWKFGAATRKLSPRPSGRSGFPTLLDAQITGDVVFRTSSGKPLVTHVDRFHLHTEATDKPVRLDGMGSYNGVPIRLEADLASFDALRDAAMPYPARIYTASGDTTLQFQGTMTEPLDLDGAKGQLELVAPTAAAILQIAGASGDFDASLRVAGPFEHDGPLWLVSHALGTLNEDTITAADVKLVEGPRGKPDDLTVNLVFDRVDLTSCWPTKRKGPLPVPTCRSQSIVHRIR